MGKAGTKENMNSSVFKLVNFYLRLGLGLLAIVGVIYICRIVHLASSADSALGKKSMILLSSTTAKFGGGGLGGYDFEWVFAGEVALCQGMHLYSTFCYLIFLCGRWCSLSLGGRMQPSSTSEVGRGGGGV
jgi:hypothetical protein